MQRLTMRLTLPTDSNVRKDIPLYSGCYTYFPAALTGVASHSKISNEKHNPGEVLHHARGKSNDHADCIARHCMDLADMLAQRERTADKYPANDLLAEANALCWRALAWSQELHERYAGTPLAPAARLPQNDHHAQVLKSGMDFWGNWVGDQDAGSKPVLGQHVPLDKTSYGADAKWPLPASADGLAKALSATAQSGARELQRDSRIAASQACQSADECESTPPVMHAPYPPSLKR